jgi:hypothetical protein
MNLDVTVHPYTIVPVAISRMPLAGRALDHPALAGAASNLHDTRLVFVKLGSFTRKPSA